MEAGIIDEATKNAMFVDAKAADCPAGAWDGKQSANGKNKGPQASAAGDGSSSGSGFVGGGGLDGGSLSRDLTVNVDRRPQQ